MNLDAPLRGMGVVVAALTRGGRGPLLIALASLVVVGSAFASQYIGGLNPCRLCWYQRIPYGITIVLGLIAASVSARNPRLGGVLAVVCAMAFAGGATVAAFHVGVEQGWWTASSACTGVGTGARSAEELGRLLENAPVIRCTDIQWSLFGISMAGYNVLVSIALTVFALLTVRELARRP